MVGIHHLTWIDNLDTGAVVLVQRHEDKVAATVSSSMNPSITVLDSYITGTMALKVAAGFDADGK